MPLFKEQAIEDTVLAVATAAGAGPRAALRLSGSLAVSALASVGVDTDGLSRSPGFRGMAVRLQVDGLRTKAWVTLFRAPRSYTREDVVEVCVPGARPLVAAIARALVATPGVRWAQPGEFTLRAFLSGRLDLTQVEAVGQLIAATSDREARAARRALAGEFGDAARGVARELTETAALIEAGIDFADEDLPAVADDALLARVDGVLESIESLRRASTLRRSVSSSVQVVLAGFPNAGKSSLLNALLGRDVAIVSGLAGTTRDPVRGRTRIGGRLIEWTDLAGVRSVGRLDVGDRGELGELDTLLEAAAERSLGRAVHRELEAADHILWIVDASRSFEDSLREFSEIDAERRCLVLNQIDRLEYVRSDRLASQFPDALLVSARRRQGLDHLVERVREPARQGSPMADGGGRFLLSAHQESLLLEVAEAVRRARHAIVGGLGTECAAADVRSALAALESLTGRVTADDILGHIFERFCIGK